MDTRKLSYILGTQFITNGNKSDLTNLFNSMEDPGTVFDIGDCVISGKIAEFIEKHPDNFVDTVNPERGEILELNRIASNNRKTQTLVTVEQVRDSKDLPDYLRSLSTDVIYHVDSQILMPTGALIYTLAPHIKITFGYLTGALGTYLSGALYNQDPDVLNEYIARGTSFSIYTKKIVKPGELSYSHGSYYSHGRVLSTNPLVSPAYLPADIGQYHLKDRLFNYTEFVTTLLRRLDTQRGEDLSLYDTLISWCGRA